MKNYTMITFESGSYYLVWTFAKNDATMTRWVILVQWQNVRKHKMNTLFTTY